MKILLFGKEGQVGWALQRALSPLGELIAIGQTEADFLKTKDLSALVIRHQPDFIVNAAAYTDVDKAEHDADIAWKINVDAVQELAEAAKKINACLVHYSTDYVFDGAKTAPYRENDQTGPLNVYGKTKLAGDNAILASGCKCLIFRTSWVFATYGKNFINTVLRLAQQRASLSIVADQKGAPTSAELIADVTALCLYRIMTEPGLAKNVNGVFHLTSGGNASWFEYARHILLRAEENGMLLKATADRITPITSAEYPVPAKRPLNSILDTGKLAATFGLVMPPWQQHVDRTLQEIFRKMKQ